MQSTVFNSITSILIFLLLDNFQYLCHQLIWVFPFPFLDKFQYICSGIFLKDILLYSYHHLDSVFSFLLADKFQYSCQETNFNILVSSLRFNVSVSLLADNFRYSYFSFLFIFFTLLSNRNPYFPVCRTRIFASLANCTSDVTKRGNSTLLIALTGPNRSTNLISKLTQHARIVLLLLLKKRNGKFKIFFQNYLKWIEI